MTAWKWVSFSVVAASLITARGDAGGLGFFPEPEYVALNRSYPSSLTTGPSGDIWFTENSADRIGRIAADGHLHEFPLPEGDFGASPTSITLGPDGNLWFIESGTRKIGRITPTGTVKEFPIPSPLNLPLDITSGPDGKLWFTELAAPRGLPQSGVVGNISVNGTINEISIDAGAFKIVSGPDDALWFTTDGLGRMATNGQYHVFPIDVIGTYDIFATYDVTVGPDGALWFTYFRSLPQPPAGPAGLPSEPTVPAVGRMTTDGQVTSFLSSDLGIQPVAITRGPEDNLWFTTQAGGIWRVNLAGTMDQIVIDGDGSDPAFDIIAGADGRMWYTLPESDRIGSIDSLFFLPVNLSGAAPIGLTRAPDDSIWFADYSGSRIGRIDKNGGLQQHELGAEHNPTAVAVAPDGSAWFTDPGGEMIGHLTTDGEIAFTKIQSLPSAPQDIVLGPDGNFWFTEYQAGAISRLTPQSGAIKRFPIPDPNPNVVGPRLGAGVSNPVNITVGPDGNLWFTDEGFNQIGRITISGDNVKFDEFPIPTEDSAPAGITAARDGNLYFVESNPGRVACIAIDGDITELGTPDPDSFPQYITVGPDDALWFTESDTNRVGRISPADGRITKFELPVADGYPTGIVGRGDGRLFVALLNTSQILYTDLAAAEPTHTVTPTPTVTRTQTPTRTATATLTVPPGSTATSTPSITRTPTATRTATATLTVPPGSTASATPSITLTPTLTPTVPPGSTETSTPEPTPTIGTLNCFGDCDGDATVSINELIAAVNIALGNAPYDSCANADADGDEEIHINDLIAAVNSALQGCPL